MAPEAADFIPTGTAEVVLSGASLSLSAPVDAAAVAAAAAAGFLRLGSMTTPRFQELQVMGRHHTIRFDKRQQALRTASSMTLGTRDFNDLDFSAFASLPHNKKHIVAAIDHPLSRTSATDKLRPPPPVRRPDNWRSLSLFKTMCLWGKLRSDSEQEAFDENGGDRPFSQQLERSQRLESR
ncbi:hypothetical protein CDD83_2219 [Cordyceps sp. RAO-2017]|nr:hypothetical protein CDD83_2219 [Cordyceps sp. RAO-2017]